MDDFTPEVKLAPNKFETATRRWGNLQDEIAASLRHECLRSSQ